MSKSKKKDEPEKGFHPLRFLVEGWSINDLSDGQPKSRVPSFLIHGDMFLTPSIRFLAATRSLSSDTHLILI